VFRPPLPGDVFDDTATTNHCYVVVAVNWFYSYADLPLTVRNLVAMDERHPQCLFFCANSIDELDFRLDDGTITRAGSDMDSIVGKAVVNILSGDAVVEPPPVNEWNCVHQFDDAKHPSPHSYRNLDIAAYSSIADPTIECFRNPANGTLYISLFLDGFTAYETRSKSIGIHRVS